MMKSRPSKGKWMTLSAAVLASFLLQSQAALAQEQSAEIPAQPVSEQSDGTVLDQVTAPLAEETQASVSSQAAKPEVEVANSEQQKSETEVAQVADVSPVVATQETSTDETVLNAPINEESVATAQSAEAEKPLTNESNAIVNVKQLWDENIKGQGTIVAVIDSGLDVTHDVLRITDPMQAKYKTKEEFEAAKAKAGIDYGKWYSDKVVFGYDYNNVSDELKEQGADSHGMHVSGIAVGNPSKKDSSGDYIYGVAPEAQLMFMRVFPEGDGGTAPFLYVRAIEDAVKLGADTINLSLGSSNGDLNDMARPINAAIDRARKAGVTVVIAAGNDSYFGEGHSLPDADKPDYGVVAKPAVAKDSIAVASYNNTHVTSEIINIVGMEDNEAFNKGRIFFSHPSSTKVTFKPNTEYTYEFVGLGKPEDLADKDLSGKVALIERGEIPFVDKVKNAKAKGAIGAVIFNNNPAGPDSVRMQMNDPVAASIPSLFIGQDIGKELSKNADKYKIRVDGQFLIAPNPDAGKMSAFTSWGLSADGELKPDISAPGGSIYSSINDNKYDTQGGTSMASPHIAGVVVLMKQYYAVHRPDLQGEALQTLIKQVLMSTAVPHIDPETGAFTSPRQQGAGIANTSKAVHSDLFVTGDDNYSSISLGNVEDVLTFNVTLHNMSNKAKSLKYITHLNTDSVKDGKITTKPRELLKTDLETIEVAANSKVVVPILVDATKFAADLTKEMVNGYFLEGFVRFLDMDDEAELVSIPFVGFRGEFDKLAVIEKPLYKMTDGEKPFYYKPEDDGHLTQGEDSDYTALLTAESEWDHLEGEYTAASPITMGTYNNGKGRYLYKTDASGEPIMAISPNGDGNRDAIALRAVFLRNFENLKVSVYRADDAAYKAPIWQSEAISGHKNYYSGQATNPKSHIIDNSAWEGKDSNGKKVADGDYVYVVSYTPAVPGAPEQTLSFKIKVDTLMPALTTGTLHLDKNYFKPRATIETGSGLYRERLYYILEPKTDENGDPVDDSAYADQLSITNRVYIQPNEDGSYTLPKVDLRGDALNPSRFWYMSEDHAGNIISSNMSEYIALGNDLGIVNFRVVDEATGRAIENLGYRYMVRDKDGKLVNESTQVTVGSHKMPFGDYTVELLLHDEEYARIVGPSKLAFTVGEDNTLQAVDFKAKFLAYDTFRLEFAGPLPKGAKVYAVDQTGKREELVRGRYVTNVYEKKLIIEPHTIQIELPRAYKASENDFVYNVVSGLNVKRLELMAKGDLSKDGEALVVTDKPNFDLAADDDQDGFSNETELLANTNPLDQYSVPKVTKKGDSLIQFAKATIDAKADDDQDGFTIEQELRAGTDPFDPYSVPKVTSKGSGVYQPAKRYLYSYELSLYNFRKNAQVGRNATAEPKKVAKLVSPAVNLKLASSQPKPFVALNQVTSKPAVYARSTQVQPLISVTNKPVVTRLSQTNKTKTIAESLAVANQSLQSVVERATSLAKHLPFK